MYIGKYIVWQLLFLYAVVMTMAISFGVFTDSIIAFALALVLGVWKVFRSNPIVHNVTEIFMYAGLAVLFVPLFDILWIVVLLLMISVYDFIAVFKSKHMIDMAKFQTKGSAFAGILVKYSPKSAATKKETKGAKKSVVKEVAEKQTNAILGGGDIVFPLLFAGVVLQSMISAGAQPFTALLKVFIIPVVVMLCVVTLLFKGERGKFYPAMPVITAGCLIGLGIVMLLP
jgi:presenilin-like A22 family membrane protease